MLLPFKDTTVLYTYTNYSDILYTNTFCLIGLIHIQLSSVVASILTEILFYDYIDNVNEENIFQVI